MAITSVLGGQGRVSDATLTAMLNSGDQDLINRANNYIEGAKKEAEELGKNKGILGIISDLFGFSKLAAAEPPSSQEFSNQFREFGDIRAGFPRQGITGNVNINPELTEEELIQKFLQTEGGDIETDPFVQQNIFQKGLNFLRETPSARVGLGAILGGPAGALAGFFANKIGGGILNAIRSFRNRGRDVEIGLPQVIQTGSEFVDEFATPNDPGTVGGSSFDTATGGTFGTSTDEATGARGSGTGFSDYS